MDYEFMNTILIDLTRANSKFKIIFLLFLIFLLSLSLFLLFLKSIRCGEFFIGNLYQHEWKLI